MMSGATRLTTSERWRMSCCARRLLDVPSRKPVQSWCERTAGACVWSVRFRAALTH